MRSIACAACGTVRWDSSLRCPECGSATTLPEPPTSVVAAPPPGPRRRILNVPWREVPDRPRQPANRRRERVEIAIALVVVGILLVTALAYDALHQTSSTSAPQIVLTSGSQENVTNDQSAVTVFTTQGSGELEGTFTVSGAPANVFVCWSIDCGSVGQDGFSTYIYSSGWVDGGSIHLRLNSSALFGVEGFEQPGSVYPTPVSIITWTTPLEVVY